MSETVTALRRFNRFHTQYVGALDARYQGSEMTLVEARVLYELAQRDAPLAGVIRTILGLDAGYLSRILQRFERRGWISRGRGTDARERPIVLTTAGQTAFLDLDARTLAAVEKSLSGLLEADRVALTGALDLVRDLLGEGRKAAPYTVRTFRCGDMGMITARQAILYDEAYGWNDGMEALLGDVTTKFVRNFQPGREQCWVAEMGGRMAGCVFLADAGDGVAQLRLLYVEPWARGKGIGEDLVLRCVVLAREAGYRELILWTHTVLASARRIYEGIGMQIRSVEMHTEFGEPVQGEIWAMPLAI